MKGIESISQRILSDAKAEADQILSQAQQAAQQSKEQELERARAEADTIVKAGEARAKDVAERIRLAAGIEGKKLIAAERQALIAEAFAQALDALIALPEAQYADLLYKLALQACKDGQGGELRMNQKDAQAFGKTVVDRLNADLPAGQVSLGSDTVDIKGGLVIVRGKIEINCALEVLVRMMQEDLSGQVAACLFGKGA